MIATDCGFALADGFAFLLLIAFVGTLNPSAGDVSVFLPLEQAALSETVGARERTALFARYSLIGSLCGAAGTLLAIVPDRLASALQADPRPSSGRPSCSTPRSLWLPGWYIGDCRRTTRCPARMAVPRWDRRR